MSNCFSYSVTYEEEGYEVCRKGILIAYGYDEAISSLIDAYRTNDLHSVELKGFNTDIDGVLTENDLFKLGYTEVK